MEEAEQSQCVYQQLGAPTLLYRNKESYTEFNDPLNLSQGSSNWMTSVNRARFRWYYPIDHNILCNLESTRDKEYLARLYKGSYSLQKKNQRTTFQEFERNEDNFYLVPPRKQRFVMDQWEYRKQKLYPSQQEARVKMLLPEEDAPPDEADRKANHIVCMYQKYDTNYIPKTLSGQKDPIKPNRYCTSTHKSVKARQYTKKRHMFSDPSYLAPIESALLREAAQSETSKDHKIQPDDPNAPLKHGNGVICFPCPCATCGKNRNCCLLHPVGHNLEKVRLSTIILPHGPKLSRDRTFKRVNLLDVGDTIRQLAQCGEETFVARTDVNCIIFYVKQSNHGGDPVKGTCYSNHLSLHQRHKIDLRSMVPDLVRSYLPMDLACHPKYGYGCMDSKIAILSRSVRDSYTNTIHHVLANNTTNVEMHYISNLLDISTIDFSSNHPMVLWSAAMSHVRPSPRPGVLSRNKAQMGDGYSLYSIDLRTDTATFQWSPSSQEESVEGVFSLSGVQTNWADSHSLFVSSSSAGKLWELDCRMPCHVISTWSIPFSADSGTASVSPFGIHGAGTIFAQSSCNYLLKDYQRFFLIAKKEPSSFGIHLYQRPIVRPTLQTTNLECIGVPLFTAHGKMSIAKSTLFVLPDVSESVFTSGLCVFRPRTRDILIESHFDQSIKAEDCDSRFFCIVSMTSRGDLYAHTIMQSTEAVNQNERSKERPVQPIFVPSWNEFQAHKNDDARALHLLLSNEYPLPSQAILSVQNTVLKGKEKIENVYNDFEMCSDDLCEIEPNPTQKTVVETAGLIGNVSMSKHYLQEAEAETETTLDCFHRINEDVQGCDGNSKYDISEAILETAEKNWDSDSSQDEIGETSSL